MTPTPYGTDGCPCQYDSEPSSPTYRIWSPAYDCKHHCPMCIEGDGLPHWCYPNKEFVGDPTMGALMFEEHYGEPAPREAI